MNRKLKSLMLRALASLAACLVAPAATASHGDIFFETYDDFQQGFSEVGSSGPDAKWFFLSVGSFVADDGVIQTDPLGLHVKPPGTNPSTGEPAFTLSVAQEQESGLPGIADHVKWLAYSNQPASSGFPGFDAEENRELSCLMLASGRTYGSEFHPFGSAVSNPNDDPRLAVFAMSTIDVETFMVFDFFITNETIYAFYERLPIGRGPELGNYAAFSYAIPVAPYHPFQPVLLKIGYDKSQGTVRWSINGVEVFEVDAIGLHLPSRQFLTLDHGGDETLVEPRQMACGMGTLTLLDGHLPSETGLVRLSSLPDFYFNPELGQPAPQTFVDDESLLSSRLFGQGAEFRVFRYWISSLPTF